MAIAELQNSISDTKDDNRSHCDENDNNLVRQTLINNSDSNISHHGQHKMPKMDSCICRICHNYDITER